MNVRLSFKKVNKPVLLSYPSVIIKAMKVVVVYKQETDYARSVMEWLRDFERQTGEHIEEIDPDSRAGASLCRTYDIVEYPTLLAIDSDGQLQNLWRGTMLPTISEVSYYARKD